MSVLQPSMLNAGQSPIGLRMRSDLIVQRSIYQGEPCWIIKDPLAMTYFRLREPEYQVLNSLAQPVSYHQLKVMLNRAFPELNTRLETVRRLVASLHQSGLLISNASGQAVPLYKRYRSEQNRKYLQLLTTLLAPRFPGWDPDRFLGWLYSKCSFFFSLWCTGLVVLSCLSALGLLAINFDTFRARLPGFGQFFSAENLLLMAAMLIVTKSIHELGHGLMCKHFGGECHEIGFMLLVMSPAMYCDTSDSWIMPSRWHRMAIGAAGMYVELFLASICCFVWWFTHPGTLHYLALNVMFLSSISTIVFNANPLMRYDGYYILADWLEIPNLSQKASLALTSHLRSWCLGTKPIVTPLLPKRGQVPLAIYSLASLLYRWFVTLSLFWFIGEVLEPYGLEAVGQLLMITSIGSMLIIPVVQVFRFFMTPGRTREIKRNRLILSGSVLFGLIAILCFVPFPHYVWATFTLRPQNAQMLFLPQGGRLVSLLVPEGEPVAAGDTVAILDNQDLKIELETLQGQLARLQSDRTAFEFMSAAHVDSARRIAETISQIQSIEKQLTVKRHQIEQLTIRATRSGVLFAPPNILAGPVDDVDLPAWTGTPLDKLNLGAFLESNTLLGSIGQLDQMEAMLVIDQSDIQLIEPGQKVVALTNQNRSQFFEATIDRVSQDELLNVPRELSQTNHGPLAVKPRADGSEHPLLKAYEAYALIGNQTTSSAPLVPGMSGYAKVRVGNSTLLNRCWRTLLTVVNFR